MEVGPGTYWDAAAYAPGPGRRFRVVRLIPSDDGPFVYARSLGAGRAGLVLRFDRWAASMIRA